MGEKKKTKGGGDNNPSDLPLGDEKTEGGIERKSTSLGFAFLDFK